MYKHFIFDFDGVLSDSRAVACREVNTLRNERFATLPEVFSPEDLSYLYCGPLKTSLRRFGLTDEQCRMFFDEHSKAMISNSDEIEPFHAVVDAIAAVIPGRASIVTSSYSEAVRKILIKNKNYRESVFCHVMGREFKQSKSVKIRTILGDRGLNASEVIHFGDMVSDLLYSRELSIAFCAVGWGYHPYSYLRAFDPEFSVENVDTFPEFLIHLATNTK